MWPLVGLFLLVAGLGVWAFRQSRAAVATPLFLEVGQGRVAGLQDALFTPLSTPFDHVVRVEVVQEPGLTVPAIRLRIITRDGLLFAGPELILGSDEAKALRPVFTELARALAQRIGCQVTTLDSSARGP